MPKATLSYSLPEEADEFDLAYQGAKLACIIEDLDNYLRAKIKYGPLTDEQETIYQEIRDKLNELRHE